MDKQTDAQAEYLEQKHWANTTYLPPDKVDKRRTVDTPPLVNVGPITIEEVREALRTSKSNKSLGPNGLTSEPCKLLDDENLMTVGQIFNQMWTKEFYPGDFAYAEVVSVYKKGNPELPENYRPISFLNSK